jgi:predicted nucleic acid-binding protein
MGLILDTSILIAYERRGETIQDILRRTQTTQRESEAGISAISAVELTHGIYRAREVVHRERRRTFTQDAFAGLVVHPVSLTIAELAGRIEGEQAAIGVSIAIEDLIIGATALHLGFDVVTLNEKHFRLIPGLNTVTL